ncbi:unnamed protein product [Caenorhabditis angaria]|uniref:WAP domain-containing protein n=1 Tax=Caenorhabditis angaria TaxID=860376 RepID=A0A9P1ILS3_9PELO|nr:unnamed protein product [Caenorhabditis angaria]
MKIFVFFTVLFWVTVENAGALKYRRLVNKWSHSDCVRPWQISMMTKPTLRVPARPIECNPDEEKDENCPAGRNSICQYSLKTLRYICCEDKKDAEIPTCPKYHETLLLTCGGISAAGQCPRGFRCLSSVQDDTVKLCCKPNRTLTYKEPESTFRENRIVPRLLPISPAHELTASFQGEKITMGQLFDAQNLEQLSEPPVMSSAVELHDEKLYTIILVDSTSKTVSWMVANIAAFDGQLEIHRRTKSAVTYQAPDVEDQPAGIHTMVLALFQQSDTWSQRDLSRIAADDEFSLATWISANSEIIEPQPIAATFYGFSTKKDDRRFL